MGLRHRITRAYCYWTVVSSPALVRLHSRRLFVHLPEGLGTCDRQFPRRQNLAFHRVFPCLALPDWTVLLRPPPLDAHFRPHRTGPDPLDSNALAELYHHSLSRPGQAGFQRFPVGSQSIPILVIYTVSEVKSVPRYIKIGVGNARYPRQKVFPAESTSYYKTRNPKS
jgi:hypothetical protein